MLEELNAKEKYSFNKLQKRLRRNVGQAIADFNMIEEGDKVMVCLSGGKDSFAMLDILMSLKASAPIHFDLVAVNLDQKQPGFPEHVLPEYLTTLGIDFKIVEEDTYAIVRRRCRRQDHLRTLLPPAPRHSLPHRPELGCTKIALGHHRDDILETLFLNMFYGGKLKSMPPKLVSDDGKNVVIRPLAYCKEKDLVRYAEVRPSHHPVQPVRLSGEPAAPGHQADDAGVGSPLPGSSRDHVHRHSGRDPEPFARSQAV
ncbi:tRNA 2-thiocytidine(32) synthetase TtcA [Aeromonas hydrophila]|uniref:tRNA 2-thiocytidine(32) synthetase TtcA n=1 Tax=Aeromonas hydrophila TaxID=644 RepID=A0A926FLQ7_AERHY|nr:tRNA 2-thiocytidine(32) synthetase TtcA [Aeromonas hydrophila]